MGVKIRFRRQGECVVGGALEVVGVVGVDGGGRRGGALITTSPRL